MLQGSIVGSNKSSTSGESSLPGVMSKLNNFQIEILIKCLSLSYYAADKLDSRPGLKFLLQKVSGVKVAANLFKQTGAAWTIKAVALFDLCLNHIKGGNVKMENIKQIVGDVAKNKNTIASDENQSNEKLKRPNKLFSDDFIKCLMSLRDLFLDLAESYIDLVLDKDGHYSKVDKIIDQPIFFLLAPTDDFPDISQFNTSEQKGLPGFLQQDVYIQNETEIKVPTEQDQEDLSSTDKSPNRPFMFSDFAESVSDEESSISKEENSKEEASPVEETPGIDKDEIYTVATGRDIKNMMNEYRKRKQKQGMPSSSQNDDVPPEIHEEKRCSIIKVRDKN